MANTTITTVKNSTLDKQFKNIAFISFVAVCAISWSGFMSDGFSDILLGVILIGLNLTRRANGIEMGKVSFLIGAFFISMGLLDGATLYNPEILPLAGLMIAGYAIFNSLQKNQPQVHLDK